MNFVDRATMSDDGDKTCPLCAEDMDLTDQQLKPCKCGYEICVWCWHQIIDMAEKENSEGRCPACRSSYNKERIVGMAANCERLMNESYTEKKYKTQKTKLKISADVRKNLSRVRVVQRNLVYIMGMPSHLANESVLERKEYFGQYGKILKLSISRPATTAQQSSSNSFSLYITYAREEDAVRCIQSVHNYTLDGKPLRACFGTTKYCHSWLRNTTCSHPDCLYLHDIGCQEDSFAKNEIISAYSRSRVPQVALKNLQQRAGIVLPPPADVLSTKGTTSSKTCVRMSLNNTTNHARSANFSSGRGSKMPNKFQSTMTTPCLQNPVKQKPNFSNSTKFHSSVSNIKCISAWDDHVSVLSNAPDITAVDGGSRTLEPLIHVSSMHDHPTVSDDLLKPSLVAERYMIFSAWEDDTTTKAHEGRNIMSMDFLSKSLETVKVDVKRDAMTSDSYNSAEIGFDEACNYAWNDDIGATSNQILDPSSCHMDRTIASLEALRCCSDQDSDSSLSEDTTVVDTCTSCISSSSSQLVDTPIVEKDGLVSLEIVCSDLANVKSLECNDNLSKRDDFDDAISNCIAPKEHVESVCLGISAINLDCELAVDHQRNDKYEIVSSNNCSNLNDGSLATIKTENNDASEKSIISNMLSLDCDLFDDSLQSANNFTRLLCGVDKECGASTLPSSWKLQNNNQSRFSFARQENSANVSATYSLADSHVKKLSGSTQNSFKNCYNNKIFLDTVGVPSDDSLFPSNITAGMLRPNMPSPPGFSVPNRAPPLGFSSQERYKPGLSSTVSDNLFHGSPPPSELELHSARNAGDLKFIDPAILAVGKRIPPFEVNNSSLGLNSIIPSQFCTTQLLMQHSVAAHQDRRVSNNDIADELPPMQAPYISSRFPTQINNTSYSQFTHQQLRTSNILNNQWSDWQKVLNSRGMGMAEIVKNERFGHDNFIPIKEEHKFRLFGSNYLYTRPYGM